MKIITFTIYLYHILLRNGTDAGVTDPAHCSQGRPRAGISIRGTAGLTLIAAPCRIGKYGRRRNEKYIFFNPSIPIFPLETEAHTAEHWFALKVFYNKVFDIEELLKKGRPADLYPLRGGPC